MRAFGTLIVSVVVGLLIAAGLMWQLGMALPSVSTPFGWFNSGGRVEEKFARFGRSIDVAGAYDALERLGPAALTRLRATDGLCQSPAFDCHGLSRASVTMLIDGIEKQRADATSATSLAVSCISACIALAGLLQKTRKS